MTGETESVGAAALRYDLNSADMAEAIAVRGVAKLLEENPIGPIIGTSPSLYQRRFHFVGQEVIHGRSVDLTQVSAIEFSGYTKLAPAQRGIDSRSPMLVLGGQIFFNSKLPPGSMNVLLLIGGPEIPPIVGAMGRRASVENAAYRSSALRAFLLTDADVTLPQALPSLVGWQPKPTLATAKAAMMAPHPLIALDALRIAARSGTTDQAELLAEWLLHPAQPAGVKATAVSILGQAIEGIPQGSEDADRLIAVAVASWEAERAYPIDAAYLRVFHSVTKHIEASSWQEQVKAIADDYSISELVTLSDQLAQSLKE
jgi:hypothetical protein